MTKSVHQSKIFFLHAAENISALLFGLVGAVMVARVFGPENLGRLSIVQAASSVFISFATLGLDHFVLRDFAVNRNDSELKGSILLAQSVGWIFYCAGLILFFLYREKFADEIYLLASVAISTYFTRVVFLKLYLQAINDALAIAISAVVSRTIALIFLAVGSINHFSYDMMVFYLPLQAIFQAIILLRGYRTSVNANFEMKVSSVRIFDLFKEATPVIFSGILYFGYSQADVLILSYFMTVQEVGIYSAAMRLIPQAIFIGHVTVITFYGIISEKFHHEWDDFFRYSVIVARLQFAVALALAISVSLLAPFLISALYGNKYTGSSELLSIAVWAWLFSIPACLFSRLLVLTRLARYELIKVILIAPLSLGLNIYLIPRYGSFAGAFVSVITYFLGDFLVYSFFNDTRFIFRIALEAIRTLFNSPLVSFRESVALFQNKL